MPHACRFVPIIFNSCANVHTWLLLSKLGSPYDTLPLHIVNLCEQSVNYQNYKGTKALLQPLFKVKLLLHSCHFEMTLVLTHLVMNQWIIGKCF